MPSKLKKAYELYDCATKFKKDQDKFEIEYDNNMFAKCIDEMNDAAEKGFYYIFFNEKLNESYLNELKKAGYTINRNVSILILITNRHCGKPCAYKISWEYPNIYNKL